MDLPYTSVNNCVVMANVEENSPKEISLSDTVSEQQDHNPPSTRRKRRKVTRHHANQSEDIVAEHTSACNNSHSMSQSVAEEADSKPGSPKSDTVGDIDSLEDYDQHQPRLDLSYEKGVKKFVCKLCGAAFTSNSYLTVHHRNHSGEKPYSCSYPDCNSAFTSSGSLRRHENSHTKARRYVCQDCGDTFSQSSSLKTHRRKHTGERPFQCDLCLRTFISSSHMKKHRQMHSGEKPHICVECGAQFSHFYNLKRHLLIHSGERPFMCRECGDAFITNDDLKRHVQTHATHKPFQCQYCPAQFSRSTRWKRHEEKHKSRMSGGSELSLVPGAHSSGFIGEVDTRGRRLSCEEVFRQWSKGGSDFADVTAGMSGFPEAGLVNALDDVRDDSGDSDSSGCKHGGVSDDSSRAEEGELQAEILNENTRSGLEGDWRKEATAEEATGSNE